MKLGVVVASVGGVSAAGVATVGGYHYFSSKNTSIKEALKGAKLISNLPKDFLKQQGEAEFESAKTSIKALIEFNLDDKVKGGEALAKGCDAQMLLDSVKHEETLKNVKTYCLVRSVSSQLSRTNKNLLGEDQEGEGDEAYTKRKNRKTPRTDVGLSDAWNGEQKDQDFKTIKPGCSSNSSKDFLATEDLYAKVLKWCTKEGATTE